MELDKYIEDRIEPQISWYDKKATFSGLSLWLEPSNRSEAIAKKPLTSAVALVFRSDNGGTKLKLIAKLKL